MKFSLLLLGLVCLWSTVTLANGDMILQAQEAYAQRNFEASGISKVEESAVLYEAALSSAQNPTEKIQALNGLAQTKYFLGTAYSEKKQKIDIFAQSIGAADLVAQEYGVEKPHKMSDEKIQQLVSSKSSEELEPFAVSMYLKGISLAQWGKLKGISTSIGRIGEVLGNMEKIKALGFESIFQFGPDRTIGRVKFTLPGIFGGDDKLSEKLLKNAYKNTLAIAADGTVLKYSVNGFTNVYLAETLYKRGKAKEEAAKKILALFVGAEPATLDQELVPENNQALKRAQELMMEWQ